MLPLELKAAQTHNLKSVDLELSPGEIVVVTGVSGAGKSSLALDTLYAEGQRRFVESFSPYARQFLERLERPPVERLEPVPAAVAVDRAAPVKSSRSTVATMTDVEPLLAALFQRESSPVCPEHGVEAVWRDAAGTAQKLVEEAKGERAILGYRVPVKGAEQYLQVREDLTAQGYRRLWLDGVRDIDDVKPSEIVESGGAEVIVDRVRVGERERGRLAEALEAAWRQGAGVARLHWVDGQGMSELRPVVSELRPIVSELRRGMSCPVCARELAQPRPGLFSYDSAVGACETCRGFGRTLGIDLEKVVPDPYKSLAQRAIRPWNGASTTWERRELRRMCERHGIPLDVSWKSLTEKHQKLILHGDGDWNDDLFPGVLGWFRWLETRTYKMHVRVLLSRYRSYDPCASCGGQRLNALALSYRLLGESIGAWHQLEVDELRMRLLQLQPKTKQGALVVEQIRSRLDYLHAVGLGYLTLDRQARTLSGGEAQRVTLTAALGTSLHHALFVLDEPSVGLHAADVGRLTRAMRALAERDNMVLVVEHDPLVVAAADRVIELGPGAGEAGGRVEFDGTPEQALRHGGATARALAPAPLRNEPPRVRTGTLTLTGVSANNLKSVDVEIPLGVLCAVSGPSGSGKSSLVDGVLYPALARRLGATSVDRPGEHASLDGWQDVARVALVDQSPLGRTSRGNAATYTKAWDPIRKGFAEEPAASRAGLSASHFSFNVDGGRCEACSGEGYETVEMQFLADVRLVCPVCRGQRFKEEVLRVTHRGVSVAQLLDSSVDEVLRVFSANPVVWRALGPVQRLGLGYVKLGQPLSTLSGGEAQRLKLARALGDKLKGTLLILDEPSAGLHADEVARVTDCLHNIVKAGGSVVVVEHDLAVLRAADWVIDLGPGSGKAGGHVVFSGTPAELVHADTATAKALRAGIERVGADPAESRRVQPTSRVKSLRIKNAREHNLKEVSVEVPHGALSVVTGPSGSGKSSLVFDVMFAEGQRRFLETLTPYARQFLPRMPKPDVDEVSGVPPSIALEQRTTRAGVNSTVATVTEVAHYLRLLFAKLGVAHCPEHGAPIRGSDAESMFALIKAVPGAHELLAPVVEARKGTYLDVFNAADRDGIPFAYCDGVRVETARPPKLVRGVDHSIDLVIAGPVLPAALATVDLRRALAWGQGTVKLLPVDAKSDTPKKTNKPPNKKPPSKKTERRFSTRSACPVCGFSVPELDPRWFSFNTAQGRCPTCHGNGVVERRAPARSRSRSASRSRGKPDEPEFVTCPDCAGSRLHPLPRAVTVKDKRYHALNQLSIGEFQKTLGAWATGSQRFAGDEQRIAEPILKELQRRVDFLVEVGLDYLSLERAARSLSGGEMQRLRLAAQLGAGLTGALYVLDEPTIGLHPCDTARLVRNLKSLVDLGSTVVVVEHDAEMIRAADHLIDLGPGGGAEGGQIIAAGSPAVVLSNPRSPTGRSFSTVPRLRQPLAIGRNHPELVIHGVSANNLRGVDAAFPIERLTVVAGVSGSGKSTLVRGVVLPAVRQRLGLVTEEPGTFHTLGPLGSIQRAVSVDQSPIGRTPRSVPATFLGIWDDIRRLYAASPDAKVAGFSATRFSFNTANGGRCTTCEGQGVITHEMSFLPDTVQTCTACNGLRFEPETLKVRCLGLSVGESLRLTVEQAAQVFSNHPRIARPLHTLVELGAGYIQLGQGAHTLSGGEAQRLKLASELTATVRHEPTLYVLDEPTTGLHQADVEKLIAVLGKLVERGDTLIVIEHHPWVIAGADRVIELGPGGGTKGGRVVASGAPAALARKQTNTADVVRQVLQTSASTT